MRVRGAYLLLEKRRKNKIENEMEIDQMLTNIPFNLLGEIYRCPMPFGRDDEDGYGFREMKKNHIKVVVVLAEKEEIRRKTGRDLMAFYRENGMKVIHLPIKDFGIPDRDEINSTIDQVIELADKGTNIAVHCSAGIGRTGLFLAELAKRANSWDGDTALEWIREIIHGAVETNEQISFVLEN